MEFPAEAHVLIGLPSLGITQTQSLDDLVSGDASDLRVEAYEEMWNVAGDLQALLFPL